MDIDNEKNCPYCLSNGDLLTIRHERGCPHWVYARSRSDTNESIALFEEGFEDGCNKKIHKPRKPNLSYILGWSRTRSVRTIVPPPETKEKEEETPQ